MGSSLCTGSTTRRNSNLTCDLQIKVAGKLDTIIEQPSNHQTHSKVTDKNLFMVPQKILGSYQYKTEVFYLPLCPSDKPVSWDFHHGAFDPCAASAKDCILRIGCTQ